MAVFVGKIHEEIAKVVEIEGVSVGTGEPGSDQDRSTWVVTYKTKPTEDQLKQVQEIIDNIEFISDEENAQNLQSRGQLQNDDWQVIRALEKALLSVASGDDLIKTLKTKEFMDLLQQRQKLRDAVKPEYKLNIKRS